MAMTLLPYTLNILCVYIGDGALSVRAGGRWRGPERGCVGGIWNSFPGKEVSCVIDLRKLVVPSAF
jgi:hypothetical protein